jgi:glycosyltransferase involved in cell wall biosynthesis
LRLADLPGARPLFDEYRRRLLAAGYEETSGWPYAFGRFDNGVGVHPLVRGMYLRLGDGVAQFGDPFATGHRGSFWRFIHEETHPGSGVSRFWYEVYVRRSRGDLRRAFPDVFGKDRAPFLAWVAQLGRTEYGQGDAGPDRAGVAQPEPPPARDDRPGLNVAGYAMSEKGLGEALRATVTALSAAGIPHCVVDFPDPGSANAGGSPVGALEDNPYPVNLIHLTALELPRFVAARGPEFLRGKYNIGFWMWELDRLPRAFRGAFVHLDEVWVASTFCLDAISRASPVPVVKVPLSLSVERLRAKGVGREYFGLPGPAFVFLFVFDAHSVLERKNPRGLIRAFRRAFPGQEDVRLVLKLVRGNRRIRDMLVAEAADARVLVVDRVLERSELNSLMDLCDCYVSLHRSEGFGLTMAEAMALGKPVIATAYSANTDFMNSGNSFPVRYELVRLDRDHGPYFRGGVWAEPSVEHAAELMRYVYEDPAAAAEVARRGRRDIRRSLSAEAIGEQIARRLDVIGRRTFPAVSS